MMIIIQIKSIWKNKYGYIICIYKYYDNWILFVVFVPYLDQNFELILLNKSKLEYIRYSITVRIMKDI
jgi:hypothetical protein